MEVTSNPTQSGAGPAVATNTPDTGINLSSDFETFIRLLTTQAENQDPLEVADRMGRPVAIVRIGSMAPPREPVLLPQFFFGNPSWAPIYQPESVTSVTEHLSDQPLAIEAPIEP